MSYALDQNLNEDEAIQSILEIYAGKKFDLPVDGKMELVTPPAYPWIDELLKSLVTEIKAGNGLGF